VRVERANRLGHKAIAHLFVRVGGAGSQPAAASQAASSVAAVALSNHTQEPGRALAKG